MGNRGQKRPESVEEFPADKRACSSLEFRPSSSSNSPGQTHMNSPNSAPDFHDGGQDGGEMDTSSSASGSVRSEEAEKDSAYGSCDSDDLADGELRFNRDILRDFQRRRSSGDQAKFKKILASLTEADEVNASGVLAALTELCEVLSFCTESSLSSLTVDSLAPVLVKQAKQESNPDIMLLAIRAITYLCDVFPRSSGLLSRHGAIPALCERLLAIEYLDVAEQCLQALEKISRDQPLACLQSGAIMAVLNYIDFFSTSVQRVALSTVVNICKKLPSECTEPFMLAVPSLCNLLQNEDRQLVENVAICLIKIVERVCTLPEMLNDLCMHGLIQQATHLIDLNSRTTVSQPIYTGLIGSLVKLASGSVVAVRTLFELNISSILKDILCTYDLSHGMTSVNTVDGHCNQVYEVLKLLNALLPASAGDQDVQMVLDKESFLANQPDLLQKFGNDILPVLLQVVSSGANLYVCYGCLSIINKLVYFSKSDNLLELLNNTNISSFLAGVFTRKEHHVLIIALQIVATLLQKLSDTFLNSFVKEGVFFSVDALLIPENCSQLKFPVLSGTHFSIDTNQKHAAKEVSRCLCYAFDNDQFSMVSEMETCKLEKDSVHNLAKHIKAKYMTTTLLDSEKGLTDVLQKLRTFSTVLTDLVDVSMNDHNSTQHEEKFYYTLHQIITILNGKETISTFEFIESGIVKSLVNYLSNGLYIRDKVGSYGISSHCDNVEKRFEVFGGLLLSLSEPLLENLPLSVLIQKLQHALSSVENFPIILSHASKQRNSFATVPNGRCVSHPCLKVRFTKEEEETSLYDYSEGIVTVDPFSSLDAIEGFLWRKVSIKRNDPTKSVFQASNEIKGPIFQVPLEAGSQGKSPDLMESESMSSEFSEMHVISEDKESSQSATESARNLREMTPSEATSSGETHTVSAEQELHVSSEPGVKMKSESPECCSGDNALVKLLFYLEGKQLNHDLTIYQAIIQQQIEAEDEIIPSGKLWGQVHTLTYRAAVEPKQTHYQECLQNSPVSVEVGTFLQHASFFRNIFVPELLAELDNSSPTYDILFLLRSLEGMNKIIYHLMFRQRMNAFAEGRIDNLDDLKLAVPVLPENEFVNSKLTEKLEQQMRDPLAVSIGSMPLWCSQLMALYPFLFGFEARCKYFRLAAFGPLQVQLHSSLHNTSGAPSDRRHIAGALPRKKFLVCRDRILDSAAQMMKLHACHKVILEVEYSEEVGTGLGPTLEFYTLVCHEFQKTGLGMWRGDYTSSASWESLQTGSGMVVSPSGLFPRPWLSTIITSNGIEFADVIKQFVLLGQVVAKALQDGRVLDLPFSKAFYKLAILGQELTMCDIQSFDPELGTVLLEFQALIDRKRYMETVCGEKSKFDIDMRYRNIDFEDLSLEFVLPGYSDYVLISGSDYKMVTTANLEEYVSLVVDATVNTGISRQVEAFRSGFNQVFPIKHLQIFTEAELEKLLCGERDSWACNELLDHIKFDHGYTASSPPVIDLLEIMQEFDHEQQRAFLQFVTGAPRLPPGGLASLNPKLTIVRKHCSKWADADLPSVMTCANYLKLPPYSSKERMKEKLLYAITEGQGSFHLS